MANEHRRFILHTCSDFIMCNPKVNRLLNNLLNVDNAGRRNRKLNGLWSICGLAPCSASSVCSQDTGPRPPPGTSYCPLRISFRHGPSHALRMFALQHHQGRACVLTSPPTCSFPSPSPAAHPHRIFPKGGAAPRTPLRLHHTQHRALRIVGTQGRVS